MEMESDELVAYVRETYDGVVLTETWGERGLFYNPDGRLARGTYFVTVKDRDSENDSSSNLDREGVYRVNFGVSAETYESLFGPRPDRPEAGGVVATGHDFASLDELLPHPTYAWANWLCVSKPTRETFDDLKPLVDEAYELARARFAERTD